MKQLYFLVIILIPAFVTAQNNVGIGIDTPETRLHIYDQTSAVMTLQAQEYDDTTGIRLVNGPIDGTHTHYLIRNQNDRLRISVDTDLGIGGTTEEIFNLLYNGDVYLDGSLKSEAMSGTGTRDVKVNSTGTLIAVEPEPTYISVHPSAFKPENNTALFEADQNFVTGILGTTNLYTPIQLPHGKTIKEFFVQYRDQTASNVTVRLMRKSLITSHTNIWTFTSSGAPNIASHTSPELNSVVDNQNYSYYIEIAPVNGNWTSALAVYTVRIKVE